MPANSDIEDLHTALSDLVKLYQFRSRDEKLWYGVTVAQAYCLRALWLGGSMTMTDLARAVTVSVSTMTGVVDQLEQRRLVRRTVAPGDRRSFRVELTPAGRKLYEKSNDEFRRRLARVARRYSPEEIASVKAFLSDVRAMVAEWREIRS